MVDIVGLFLWMLPSEQHMTDMIDAQLIIIVMSKFLIRWLIVELEIYELVRGKLVYYWGLYIFVPLIVHYR